MTESGHAERIASLDAVRGLAAFAVAVAHYLAYKELPKLERD